MIYDLEDFWVVSDTHWFHQNIVKFSGRDKQIALLDPERHWDHNAYMVERWNAVVGPDDPILHLGDLYFWRNDGHDRFADIVAPQLNGDKYLIMGNHDKDSPSTYEALGFKVVEPFRRKKLGRRMSFSHYPHPVWSDANDLVSDVHIHGHIHNNGYPLGPGKDGWKEGTVPTAPGQINVSVEMIDYTPQKLSELVRGVRAH